MGKRIAITMLIIGGILLFFGISAAVYWLLVFGWFEIIPGLALTFGAAFGVGRLRGVFEDHFWLSKEKFIVYACVSPVAAAVMNFVIAMCLDNGNNFARFSAALGRDIFAFIWLITAAAAVILGSLILKISENRRSKNAE